MSLASSKKRKISHNKYSLKEHSGEDWETKRRKFEQPNDENHVPPIWINIDSEALHRGLNNAVDNDDCKTFAQILTHWNHLSTEILCSAFWAAFNRKQTNLIKTFISANLLPNPNLYPLQETLPLFVAVEQGDEVMVEILCTGKFEKAGIRLRNGCTPLHVAAMNGNIKLIDMLLQAQFNPNIMNEAGVCPLHLAISQGHEAAAIKLLDGGAKAGKAIRDCKTTPLMSAAIEGHKTLTEVLLNRQIRVDAKDESKQTALYKAVLYSNVEIVKLLLNKGANPNVKVEDQEEPGETPLMAAIYGGHEKIVKILLETGRININYCNGSFSNIHLAICEKNNEIIQLLIEAGADLHKLNDNNDSCLHAIAWTPHVDDEKLAKQFIEAGLDINLLNKNKQTPLSNAVSYNNICMVRFMIQANCSVDFDRNFSEQSAFKISLDNHRLACAYMLIEAGCDVTPAANHNIFTDYQGDFLNWLQKRISSPKSLKNLCRIRVRESIGIPFSVKLSKLNLTKDMMNYLSFAEFDEVQINKFPPLKRKSNIRKSVESMWTKVVQLFLTLMRWFRISQH